MVSTRLVRVLFGIRASIFLDSIPHENRGGFYTRRKYACIENTHTYLYVQQSTRFLLFGRGFCSSSGMRSAPSAINPNTTSTSSLVAWRRAPCLLVSKVSTLAAHSNPQNSSLHQPPAESIDYISISMLRTPQAWVASSPSVSRSTTACTHVDAFTQTNAKSSEINAQRHRRRLSSTPPALPPAPALM